MKIYRMKIKILKPLKTMKNNIKLNNKELLFKKLLKIIK